MTEEAVESRPTVFVSYAHEDKVRAQAVVAALTQAGLTVWWDGLIAAGAEFAQLTEQALESAAAVVVLWSRSSVTSHWVRDEATRGRDRGCLIPVSLDGVEPPIGFRQYLVIGLSSWRGDGDAPEFQAVIRAVNAARGQSTAGAPPVTALPMRGRARRRLLVGGAGATLTALGVGGWLGWRHLRGRPNADANSVAVLPFANIGGDKADNYFSDGLSADVRAALAHNPALRVIAQISSEQFRNAKAGATSIAETLGVAYLLDGNVRRTPKNFRISAELIDGLTGFTRWQQSFEGSADDVFAVQGQIAAAVLSKLILRDTEAQGGGESLTATDSAVMPGGTGNPAAYDAYLRGRAAYNRSEGEESDRQALAEFDSAIAADPRYAAAHAARARCLIIIANRYEDSAHTAATYDEAVKAARMATSLAPDSADAQSTLAFALFQAKLDIRGAREPYERSRQLGAGDASVMGRYALYCARTGREAEAVTAMSRAVDLDPINPLVHLAMGSVLYAARRYADALAPIHRALELNPKLSGAPSALGNALYMVGRMREAQEAFDQEPQKMMRLPGLAITQRKLGNEGAARSALETLRSDLGDSALYQQAEVFSQWGDRDAAIRALGRAVAQGDSGLIFLRSDPLMDPLRSLPEFPTLLRKLGFD
jgi:TolB-like protein/tetratricopeptide (TPR) repeat protein